MNVESKLPVGDKLSLNMIRQFLGISNGFFELIRWGTYCMLIDYTEDRLYILIETGDKEREDYLYEIKAVYIWSKLLKVLASSGGNL